MVVVAVVVVVCVYVFSRPQLKAKMKCVRYENVTSDIHTQEKISSTFAGKLFNANDE